MTLKFIDNKEPLSLDVTTQNSSTTSLPISTTTLTVPDSNDQKIYVQGRDLITWTSRTPAEENSNTCITWSPELGRFVVTAQSGTNRISYSDDGINWIAVEPPSLVSWYNVLWVADLSLFVAVANSTCMTSPDGITWTLRTIVANNHRSIAWSSELQLLVVVAQNGTNRVSTSPTGVTWTERTTPTSPDTCNWQSVCYSPELRLFVAVANSGTNRIMTSNDGLTWVGRVSPTVPDVSNWNIVTWSPELGLFVALASSGTNRVMTSTDGINWTGRTIQANTWRSLIWSSELAVFVAVSETGTNRVNTSLDGLTWTNRDAIEASTWFSVTFAPELGLFVAVSFAGKIMTLGNFKVNLANGIQNGQRMSLTGVSNRTYVYGGDNVDISHYIPIAPNSTAELVWDGITSKWISETYYTGSTDIIGDLTVSGTPKFEDLPAVFAYRTGGDTASVNTYICNVTVLNNTSSFSPTTGIFTVPVRGIYEIHFYGISITTAVGEMLLLKNDSSTGTKATWVAVGDNFNISALLVCAVGDTIKLQVSAGSVAGTTNNNGLLIKLLNRF